MDGRRFPTEAGCRVGKSLREKTAGFGLVGETFFFGSVSFGVYQKK